MDAKSVSGATDKELIELGLIESGHRIALKVFCRINDHSKQEKKNQLSALVQAAGVERISSNRKRRTQCNSKCVNLGWKHYDSDKQKYISVREVNGGGIRQHDFDIDAGPNVNYENILL